MMNDPRLAALRAKVAPLMENRTLTVNDIPDVLELIALQAQADPDIRAHFASTDETVQITAANLSPEQWMWIRFDHGNFLTGRGQITPTLTVEFADDKTLIGMFTGAVNPQTALFTGKMKVSPIARAIVFAEFFLMVTKKLQ